MIFNPARAVRGAAHDPRGLPGHRLPGRVGLRGRDAARTAGPPPPARAADPAHRRRRSRRRSSSPSATPRPARSPSDQPIKFAAMECVQTDPHGRDRVHLRPLHVRRASRAGSGSPGFDSFLVGLSTNTKVTGLDTVPPSDRPPANTMLHWAFDTMVGICSVLIAAGALVRVRPGGAVATSRRTHWFLRAGGVSGVAAIVALECGWIVTEVGRQPWIVYNVMRTEDAVTGAERRLGHLLGRARCSTRRSASPLCSSCARWRGAGERGDRARPRCRTAPASRCRRPSLRRPPEGAR